MPKFVPADQQRMADLEQMRKAIDQIKQRLLTELAVATGVSEEAYNRAYVEAEEFLVLKGVAEQLDKLFGETYRAQLVAEAQLQCRQN